MAAQATTAADVLVIFGITGDLAKKQTFRALYRLERRGELRCPVVGVAVTVGVAVVLLTAGLAASAAVSYYVAHEYEQMVFILSGGRL